MNFQWTDQFHLKLYEMHNPSKNTPFPSLYQDTLCILTEVCRGAIQNDADLIHSTHRGLKKIDYFWLVKNILCKCIWDLHFHHLCEITRNAARNSESNPTFVTGRIYLFYQPSQARLQISDFSDLCKFKSAFRSVTLHVVDICKALFIHA